MYAFFGSFGLRGLESLLDLPTEPRKSAERIGRHERELAGDLKTLGSTNDSAGTCAARLRGRNG